MAPHQGKRWALPLWSTTASSKHQSDAIVDRSQRDSHAAVLPLDVRLRAPANPPTHAQLVPRQQITTVPSVYGQPHFGPDPGTVVGITLGSIGGFLLILYLIYTVANIGSSDNTSSYGTASVVSRRTRRSEPVVRRRHHHHHRSPRRERETVEVRRSSRGPVVVEEVVSGGGRRVSGDRVERVVLEETRRTSSRARAPPPRVVSESSGSETEDEVVVIEEHSPPRRHRSKRRSSSRRESGYRDIDPDRFGGGDSELRSVRRGSGSRRR
jgi:hypothetical protein